MSISGSGSALGIDHGTKKTGFAVVDPLRISVAPLDVYHGPGDGEGLLEHVTSHCSERDVTTFVVGYPLNMDGSVGPRARDVDAFIERLEARYPTVPVVRVDERLTTKEAESQLTDAGRRGRARRAARDAWSAAVLLEEWIRAGEPG